MPLTGPQLGRIHKAILAMTDGQQRTATHIVMQRPDLDALPEIAAPPSGYTLRTLRDERDLEPLAATLSAAFAKPWDVARVRAKLTEAPDVKAVYVVAWQGQPVATVSSLTLPDRFPGSGIVHWLGTQPGHAQRGLGSVLMTRVLHDFVQRGCRDAVLETDDERLPAIALYLKFGFIPVYAVQGENHRGRWSAIFRALLRRGPGGRVAPWASG